MATARKAPHATTHDQRSDESHAAGVVNLQPNIVSISRCFSWSGGAPVAGNLSRGFLPRAGGDAKFWSPKRRRKARQREKGQISRVPFPAHVHV